jgi:CRISPR-associated endonuclease/helicase Cas3
MSRTPDALSHVWAKSARGGTLGETLTDHTHQVVERLASWRSRYPDLPQHTECAVLWDLGAWVCLLHDLGKAARGFQEMLRGGPRFRHRHEVLSLVAVGWLDVTEEVRELVAAGVATHHKDLPVVQALYPLGSEDRQQLLDELSPEDEEGWLNWLAGAGAPDLVRLGFAPLPKIRRRQRAEALASAFCALQRLGERLEDIAATEPTAITACVLRGLVMLSDHAGSAHASLPHAGVLDSVSAFLRTNDWRFTRGLEPHQRASASAVGHCILIAPTGSGKTEASLLWAARQREDRVGAPSLFYMLPFRASLNAMRRRLPSYGFGDGQVVLQHAAATSSLYRYFLDERSYTASEAESAARHERNLASLMTAPVRVLTPYQLLRAFFGLKAHEAVLTDAAGGLFVLDELHAYDVERLALILAAVEHLAQRLGARFFAMSATFPAVLRIALSEALGERPGEIVATAETFRRFERHRLLLSRVDLLSAGLAREMLDRQARGEAVLAVATTVQRAQALFDELSRELPAGAVALLHSRFTAEDRARKEQDLAARVGTGRRNADAPGTILVATQVVEVSLDVDFDVLFTDPAPLEALIQRFGRVNRGLRGGLRDVVVCEGEGMAGCGVYPPGLIARAIEALRPVEGEAIDEALLARLVDAIYEPMAEAWLRDVRRRVHEARDSVVKSNRPLSSHDELKELFEDLFDGCEVVPEAKEAELRQLEQEEPLRAAFLRVPISNGQRARLRRVGRLDGEIARVPYDALRGLDLTFPDHEP